MFMKVSHFLNGMNDTRSIDVAADGGITSVSVAGGDKREATVG